LKLIGSMGKKERMLPERAEEREGLGDLTLTLQEESAATVARIFQNKMAHQVTPEKMVKQLRSFLV